MPTILKFRASWRRARVPCAAALGTVIFAYFVNGHYPLREWLFWRYLGYWALTGVWVAGCLSAGDALMRWLLPNLAILERLVLSFAAGVWAFSTAILVGGLLHLFGPVFFCVLPFLMLASGGAKSLGLMRRVFRHRARLFARPGTLTSRVVTLFGVVGLLLVYFTVLTPDNAAADSHWYHLAIPERYATQGAIRAFPEGWYMGALPQLAPLVYTWAFLLPQSTLFDRVELAAHLEFAIFLWTLVGIPVLVRWAIACARPYLLETPKAAGTWVAIFLFPSLFIYDSSLGIAADHITAFFVIPAALTLRRVWRRMDAKHAAAFAIPIAGGLLTKYQAMIGAVLPLAAFAVRALWLVIRGSSRTDRRRVIFAIIGAVCAGLILTASHWLKNWIWYGDPVYPYLHQYLKLHPWSADASQQFEHFYLVTQLWPPKGDTTAKLLETSKALFTFSFVPHDFEGFHHDFPTFGSLFTLTLLPLVFMRGARRIWALVAQATASVLVWYWVSHWDRYLQIVVPLMAAAVGAIVCVVWASGLASKVAITSLVAIQAIWGADIPFYAGHVMIGGSPLKRTIDLLSSGYRKDKSIRDRVYGFSDLARSLPRDATVLVHDMNDRLGIERPTVSDIVMWQAGLRYGVVPSPRALYEQLKSWEVTHVLWRQHSTTGYDTLAGDLTFFAFITLYVPQPTSVDGFLLARLPTQPPPAERWHEWPAAVFVCSENYPAGQYQLGDLNVPTVGPRQYPAPRVALRAGVDAAQLVRNARVVAYESRCGTTLDVRDLSGFKKVAVRNGAELWVRP